MAAVMPGRRGLLLVLSSPSGAGKTTLAKRLMAADPGIGLSISVTTRTPRPGETEGVDYFFRDEARFMAMRDAGELLEWAKVFGNFYATPRAAVEAAIGQGRDLLFDIDWQGAQQLKEKLPQDLVRVFILPPTAAALESRLRDRAQDAPDVVARRMAEAASQMSHWPEYDYVIINEDLERSVAQLIAILTAERLKRERQVGLSAFVRGLVDEQPGAGGDTVEVILGHALVVGGSSSVGPEVIAALSPHFRHITSTYRGDVPTAVAGNVVAVVCDYTDSQQRKALLNAITATGAGLDCVVILAGAILGKNLQGTSDEDMDRLVGANLTGPARLLRDLMPAINAQARVLVVSSIAGERGSFDPLYAATKGALIPFAKSLATWAADRFTVTVVAPGPIEDSRMVRQMSPERVAHHRKATPTGEFLTAGDLARILADLAQPHWRHANGAVIRVNGGAYV